MIKFAFVGTGSRGTFAYLKPICNEYSDCAKICGVYDIDRKRAEAAVEMTGKDIPIYDDFDEMLKDIKPDAVIVTSIDCTHDEYIVRALDFGCDVISEKPLTTTPEKFMRIYNAEKRNGKKVTTTFNCRYMNHFERIKELLMSGVLGDICSVHYEWLLDRDHGASYFRRWHRERKNSGSLLIHKSTHHFELLNWFLDDEPVIVNAFGTRRVYGDASRKKNERCFGCPAKDTCEYYYDITANESDKKLYFDCEDSKGYIRDKCVFSEEIDIEDTVSVSIKYKKGTVVSYSLTAHSPYEGAKIVFNGTKARAEFKMLHGGGMYGGSVANELEIFYPSGEVQKITIPKKDGSHGGSDSKILNDIIRGVEYAPLGQAADTRAGGMSAGIGMAANISMKEGRSVKINEIIDI